MTWSIAAAAAVCTGILSFCIQLVCLRSPSPSRRLLPVTLLAVLHLCNLLYYLSGLAQYDPYDLLSWQEVTAVVHAVVLTAGVAGVVLARIAAWLAGRLGQFSSGRRGKGDFI